MLEKQIVKGEGLLQTTCNHVTSYVPQEERDDRLLTFHHISFTSNRSHRDPALQHIHHPQKEDTFDFAISY